MNRRNSDRKKQGTRRPRGEARESGNRLGVSRGAARDAEGKRHHDKGGSRDPTGEVRRSRAETRGSGNEACEAMGHACDSTGEAREPGVKAGDPPAGAHTILDTVGLLCPAPIMKAAQGIKELQCGQILEIISDDPGIEVDMPAWCRSTGNELLRIEKRGLEFHVLVRKGSASCPDV